MSKNTFILDYEQKCEDVIKEKNIQNAHQLVKKIVSVFENDIPNIESGLDTYSLGCLNGFSQADYLNDIEILNEKLENYRLNIKKLPPDAITKDRNTTFNINNNNTATANATNDINISFEQTIKKINMLSNDILNDDEKQELEDKLASLQVATDCKDKEKIGKKLTNLIQFAITKGPEVFIAISNFVNNIVNNIIPLFK